MPEDAVFHERNASALDRVGDDAGRFARRAMACVESPCLRLRMIVPIDFDNVPTEAFPLVGEGLEAQRFGNGCEGFGFC